MKSKEADLDTLKEISNRPYFVKKNFLTPKRKSLPYFQYRIFRPLLKLYYKSFKLLKGPTPWTSPASIEIFEQYLDKNKIGFEWGSGSSTAFFAKRLQKLISVEHNKSWHKKVLHQLQENGLVNVEYHFVAIDYPDKHLDKDGYQVAFNDAQTIAYREYFSLIDQYPDNSFDLILIDGRARVKCGKHAIPKLKKGGLLVLDNSERPRYEGLKKTLKSWPCIWTTNGLTDTTIWIKP